MKNNILRCSRLPLLFLIVFVIGVAGIFLYENRQSALSERQAMIHQKQTTTIPFSLSQTTHIFKKTSDGGIQQVIAKDPKDTQQISLIRMHLQMEAGLFQKGNFLDPSGLHGEEMPSLKELSQEAENIVVSYSDLPNGAQISLRTKETSLVSAIHKWFDAQVSDHGSDAMEM